MSLPYDHAGMAAIVLTRIAAEESEGPGQLTGRMTEYVADVVERKGPGTATEVLIALARQHFRILDAVAEVINLPVNMLLDALEVEQMESLEDGD